MSIQSIKNEFLMGKISKVVWNILKANKGWEIQPI